MSQADSTTMSCAGRIRLPYCAGVVVLLVLFACSHDAFALDPKKAITQYVHDVWRMEDGLPSNNVGAILQTRDGYLWFGTEGGLARFDGVQLRLFNQTEATKNYITRALYEDRAGNLWIGTSGGGLVKYKDGKFTTYTTKDGLVEDRVGAIYEDREGNLWIGTASGLSRFSAAGFAPPIWRNTGVGTITEGRDGGLWVGGGGLGQMKNGAWTFFSLKDGLLDNGVNSVYEDHLGSLWIGTNRGLNRWADGRFMRYTMRDGFPENRITSIYEDREGNLWIGTFGGGLGRLKDGKYTSFTSKDGLTDDRVVSIYEDREGNLWVGTYGGGVNRFKDGKVMPYTTQEGLSENWTYTVYEDRAGNLWVGTKHGLMRIKTGDVTTYTTKDGLSHNIVRSVFEDREGNLWIGTSGGGLNRFKDGRFASYTIRDTYNDVRCVYQDRQDRLWVGGLVGRGMAQFSEGRLMEYPIKDGISARVAAILEDRGGYLWVGTNRGLVRLKEGEFTRYTTNEGLSSLDAMALYEDREGVLWIGTYGGGLNRFKDGKFASITMGQGLFDNVVYRILEDDRGNFWLSGNKGISRVSKRELNDLAEGKIKSITSVAFGLSDGMKAIECSGGHQPAGWKTRDGRLWFPTTKGVVMIDPSNIPTNTVLPPVYVEQVKIDGGSIEMGGRVELEPGKKDFEFHYTALSYLDPNRVKFKYQLEGYDDKWVEADTRRVAYYTHIPPGAYRFRAMACNNDGVWNETGAAFEFYLAPHFYQTGWFYGLGIVILISVGPGVYLLRVRQLKARQHELEAIVAERTKELKELNESLEQRVRDGVKALAESERMAAYGQMVAGVAHEVRHPIFGVRTAAYVLKENFEDRQQAIAMLDTIERETRRMMELMNDLLEFARPKPLFLAPAKPQELLEEVVQTYRAEHDPQFPEIVLAPNPALPEIVVDRGRLTQVLVNLIQNAAKHADGLTTVTLSMNVAEGAPHLGEGPAELCIRVQDDGAGIAPEHLPHIFEPFFTTGHGTGLGLAIVQRIVKEHGGVIRAESQPGQGTTFSICLPTKHTEHTNQET